VDAERQVSIAEFKAKAAVASAQGESTAKKINADADATVTRTVGDATAERTRAIGTAEADVITLKIRSYGSQNYAVVQVAEALSKAGVKLVPDIIAAGSDASGGSMVNALLGTLLRDLITPKGRAADAAPPAELGR
jgi:regulator of protease activity HflC (stomatin/prohibitin superfamily)